MWPGRGAFHRVIESGKGEGTHSDCPPSEEGRLGSQPRTQALKEEIDTFDDASHLNPNAEQDTGGRQDGPRTAGALRIEGGSGSAGASAPTAGSALQCDVATGLRGGAGLGISLGLGSPARVRWVRTWPPGGEGCVLSYKGVARRTDQGTDLRMLVNGRRMDCRLRPPGDTSQSGARLC